MHTCCTRRLVFTAPSCQRVNAHVLVDAYTSIHMHIHLLLRTDALPSTIVCGNSREDRGSEFKVVGTTLLSAILKVAKVPKGDKKATTLLARVQAALVDVEDSSLKRKPRIDDTLHKV